MKKLTLDPSDKLIVKLGNNIDLEIPIYQAHMILTNRKKPIDTSNADYEIKPKVDSK